MVAVALIVGLLAKYGPVLVNEVVDAWKESGQPTKEEIEELAKRVPPPTHYFPDAAGPGG